MQYAVLKLKLTEYLASILNPDDMVFRRVLVELVWRTLRSRTGAARLQATSAEHTRKTLMDVRIIFDICGVPWVSGRSRMK